MYRDFFILSCFLSFFTQGALASEMVASKVETETAPGSSVEPSPLPSRLAVDIKVGANVSTGRYSEQTSVSVAGMGSVPANATLDGSTAIGFAVSAAFEIPVAQTIFVQPELAYVQKGFSNDISAKNTRTIHFNYLELPILLKIKGKSEKIRPFAFVGAAPGLLISQGYQGQVDSMTFRGHFDAANFNRFGLAAVGGLGADIAISEKYALLVEGRYSRGLLNVMNKSFGSDAKMFFHGVQIQAGLQIRI